MKKTHIKISNIPAIVWGEYSNKVYLYIHGQGGNKEEADNLANIICQYGWQILSIDLPEHGERKEEDISFTPWRAFVQM